jgi:hypothetical protein
VKPAGESRLYSHAEVEGVKLYPDAVWYKEVSDKEGLAGLTDASSNRDASPQRPTGVALATQSRHQSPRHHQSCLLIPFLGCRSFLILF